jgi:hypothetical protein
MQPAMLQLGNNRVLGCLCCQWPSHPAPLGQHTWWPGGQKRRQVSYMMHCYTILVLQPPSGPCLGQIRHGAWWCRGQRATQHRRAAQKAPYAAAQGPEYSYKCRRLCRYATASCTMAGTRGRLQTGSSGSARRPLQRRCAPAVQRLLVRCVGSSHGCFVHGSWDAWYGCCVHARSRLVVVGIAAVLSSQASCVEHTTRPPAGSTLGCTCCAQLSPMYEYRCSSAVGVT